MSIPVVGALAERTALGIVVLGLFASMAVACSEQAPQIDFASREPPVEDAGKSSPSATLRMAVAPVLSALPTSSMYEELADYLSLKLGTPVQLVQGKTYAEINDLLKSGDVDLALVCTNPYLQGREDFGMEMLVAPQVNGDTAYYSLLIVPRSSHARSLADLRGATFAFSDPLSNSGRLAPLYQLARLGETPDSFFERSIFTYSHDGSIRAVAEGVVEAAAVDSLVYRYLSRTNPTLTGQLRVIDRWGPFGINPIVVHPRLDPDLKGQLRQALMDMHADEEGKSILTKLMIDRLVVPEDSIYDSVREMRSFLSERGLRP